MSRKRKDNSEQLGDQDGNQGGLVPRAMEMAAQLEQYAAMIRCLCQSLQNVEAYFPEVAVKLNQPFRSLGLSVRAGRALDDAGFETIADIVSKSEQEIRLIRDIGDLSLAELKERLADAGLKLKR
jgi:DNA-directed RNA polymerase alpha subunit